jgi:hypothetical protein
LWHWPLLSYLHIVSNDKLPPAAAAFAVAASLALAVLSYYFIEQPFRHSTRRAGPMLIRYAAVSLFLLAVCGSIWMSSRISWFPDRFPVVARVEQETAYETGWPCAPSEHKLKLTPPCYDVTDKRPAVAIWGDSHANALAPSLRSIAKAHNYGFVQLSKPACLPTPGATSYGVPFEEGGRQCMEFNRMALRLLLTDRHIQIVVLAGRWSNFFRPDGGEGWLLTDSSNQPKRLTPDAASSLFRESLAASIQDLQAAGKQVVILEDSPTFDFNPVSRYLTAHIPVRRLLAQWMSSPEAFDPGASPSADTDLVASANAQLSTTINSLHGVSLIDLYTALCGKDIDCPYRIGEHMLYHDPHHLTRYGADYALRDFRLPALVPATNTTR